ncbi:MAG TPA: hypothetical protein VFF72_05255 [Caldimonas sp.]|nr:hypothetical protein [Caldimonas sp.]
MTTDPPLLNLSVHSLPDPQAGPDAASRTRRGRWTMIVVLLICAAPVVASYLAFYFDLRPSTLTNYSDLIVPPRPLPADLPLRDLRGRAVAAPALQGQWLLVVVSGGACDANCEHRLWLQRQLHEAIGGERDRVDKVWFVDDSADPRDATLRAVGAVAGGAPQEIAKPSVLRVDRRALGKWLEPARGHALEDHLYVVDPRGNWMMRAPANADPGRLKRDIDRLLRASASWDRPSR